MILLDSFVIETRPLRKRNKNKTKRRYVWRPIYFYTLSTCVCVCATVPHTHKSGWCLPICTRTCERWRSANVLSVYVCVCARKWLTIINKSTAVYIFHVLVFHFVRWIEHFSICRYVRRACWCISRDNYGFLMVFSKMGDCAIILI